MRPEDSRSYNHVMRPPQLRKLLADAGLTQKAAAELLGMTDRQMRRYVSGENPVPRVVDLALRYVIEQREKEDR